MNDEGRSKVRDFGLLDRAASAWMSWGRFREERERNKRYTFGDQWCDLITIEGETMTEEQWIRKQGCEPLKNNMIRRLVRSVVGVFRQNFSVPKVVARDPGENEQALYMNRLLDMNSTVNSLDELYARTMEEFLISGVAIHRKWYGVREGVADCWTDYVHPATFFAETTAGDFRGWDTAFLGQIHDYSFSELCTRFAMSPEGYDRLSALYCGRERGPVSRTDFGYSPETTSFFVPRDEGICRVIEVWERVYEPVWRYHDRKAGRLYETVKRIDKEWLETLNREREEHGETVVRESLGFMNRWRFTFLAPSGEILSRGYSPYRHGEHPFVVKAYPLIDGEVHSFVADVIDQQRYTNRLITLYDWAMRASAKGVLLIPAGTVPHGTSIRKMADQWSRFNGVIEYRQTNTGAKPEQVSANATNVGITELLNIQMKMFEEISGVSSALQGKLESSTMSGTLFDRQTRNALAALLDLTEAFRSFIIRGAIKDASNIRQFYREEELEAVAGEGAAILGRDTARFSNLTRDFRFV